MAMYEYGTLRPMGIAPAMRFKRASPIGIEHRPDHPKKAFRGVRRCGRSFYQTFVSSKEASSLLEAIEIMQHRWDNSEATWWEKL